MGKVAKELTPTERTINIIIVAVLLVYGTFNAYLVITAYTKLDKNVGQLSEIVTNWQTKTISDIQVLPTCPTGYEAAFKDRYWPGVDTGCWCGDVSDAVKQDKNITCAPFCHAACTTVQSTAGCEDVSGKAKQLLNFWDVEGSNAAVQICLKRTTESWDQIAPLSSGNCPIGYLKCGTSEDFVFCTKESSCPVSSITVGNYDSNTCVNTANVGCHALPNSKQIIFERGTDALPLAEFTLNEFAMCNLKSTDNVTPGRKTFELLDAPTSSCTSVGNSRWTRNAAIAEDQLFKANGLTTYIASLDGFDETGMNGYYPTGTTGASFTWAMFSRSYIPWKVSCRDRMQSFIDKKEFVDKSKSAQLALLVIGCISTFFLGIVLSIMEIQNLRGVDLSCIDGKGEEERTKLKRFKKFVNYGFKFVQIPFQIWAIILATGSKNLFNNVAGSDCSLGDYDATIDFLAANLTSTHRSNIIALVTVLATLLLDVILAAWESRKKTDSAVTPTPQPAQEMNQSSSRPLQFDQSSPVSPVKPQAQPQPTITIELQHPVPQQYPQQYPQQQPAPMQFTQQHPQPQQQYPQQQPAPMQFAPQQYPPQQQYPQQQPAPMQFTPQQQYPQQQPAPMQFAPQQFPPQQQQQQYPRY